MGVLTSQPNDPQMASLSWSNRETLVAEVQAAKSDANSNHIIDRI